MPLVIRKIDTSDPGAVLVEGIGAFVMAPTGELVPPADAALSDEDVRRIYAALPPGYTVEEASATEGPPAPRSKPGRASKGAQTSDPDPDTTTAPEGAPTPDGGDS